MSAKLKPQERPPDIGDEYAFRRRRTHSQIEAMTGLILQAVGYPSKRHRDFICALQSTNSGEDARVPYTPYRRAHLTLADYMQISGSPETRRKAVYRESVVLRTFQKRAGLLLFHVTPGSEDEATTYIDYLTPAADAAVQRALSSPLWKTDKAKAKREAVEWAVSQLPRTEREEESQQGSPVMSLTDYEDSQERRLRESIERVADEIEKRGGDDYEWLHRLSAELARIAESRRKTAPARRDYSSLSLVEEMEVGAGGGTAEGSGDNTTGDRSVLPPSVESEASAGDVPRGGGTELSAPPAASAADALPFDEPALFDEADDEEASAQPPHLTAALQYARLGWPVFPLHNPDARRSCSCVEGRECRSPGKHPRTRKGLKDATTDRRQIRAWWRSWPEANVGLAMGSKSGLVALDVDPRAGGDASISELIDRYGELPQTLEASTGGGGTHVLFAHPGVAFKNSSSVLGEGLDVKTDGGYVVAAPSLHASGRRYSWSSRQRPAKLPRWLLNLLTAEKSKAAPYAAPKRRQAAATGAGGPPIAEGSRNDRLFRIACAMRGNGAGLSEIEAELLRVNAQQCSPPLDGAEVRKVAASAARYLPNGT